jgi:hypothetical protein
VVVAATTIRTDSVIASSRSARRST